MASSLSWRPRGRSALAAPMLVSDNLSSYRPFGRSSGGRGFVQLRCLVEYALHRSGRSTSPSGRPPPTPLASRRPPTQCNLFGFSPRTTNSDPHITWRMLPSLTADRSLLARHRRGRPSAPPNALVDKLAHRRFASPRGPGRAAEATLQRPASGGLGKPLGAPRRLVPPYGTIRRSSYLWSTVHTGLDFAAPKGTALVAVTAGVVTSTGYAGSYGNRTVVELSDGTELWYSQQSSRMVSPGELVSPGKPSARSGPPRM